MHASCEVRHITVGGRKWQFAVVCLRRPPLSPSTRSTLIWIRRKPVDSRRQFSIQKCREKKTNVISRKSWRTKSRIMFYFIHRFSLVEMLSTGIGITKSPRLILLLFDPYFLLFIYAAAYEHSYNMCNCTYHSNRRRHSMFFPSAHKFTRNREKNAYFQIECNLNER